MTCSFVLVSGCGTPPQIEVQTKVVHDEVPESLLQPVEVRPRKVAGLQGVADVLVDAAEALATANCQLSGLDSIVRANRGLPLRDWSKWCPEPVVTQ
jgi:hypothetical protein